MKKILLLFVVLLSSICLFASPATETKTLTVYAYDTFCGDWGPSADLIPLFEEESGIKVNLVSCGNALEAVNKVILEGENTKADVILGITDDIADKAYPITESYNSKYISDIDEELIFDKENRIIPFDWGAFSFVWDSESGITPPSSLMDLTSPYYKDKIILIDPRTSSVGTGLLMWTYNALGDGWKDWWVKAEENALTTASGWSSGYGLFTEGEAPIVISYTTSPVYHVMNEDTERYQALVFDEGHEVTIEGVGIVKGTKHRSEAEAFIDFLLSEGQETLAVTNSMYPTVKSTKLPEAYAFAPKPTILFSGSSEKASALIDEWTELITK